MEIKSKNPFLGSILFFVVYILTIIIINKVLELNVSLSVQIGSGVIMTIIFYSFAKYRATYNK